MREGGVACRARARVERADRARLLASPPAPSRRGGARTLAVAGAVLVALPACRPHRADHAPRYSQIERVPLRAGLAWPEKTVSLTYDDGPDGPLGVDSVGTEGIARYLRDEGIHATFFVNGCRLDDAPPSPRRTNCARPAEEDGGRARYPRTVLESLVALGHRVANHTQDHVLTEGRPGFARSYPLAHLQAILDPYIPDGIRFFRPPGNEWERSMFLSAVMDASLDGLVGPVDRDVDPRDWECLGRKPPAECARDAFDAIEQLPRRSGIVQLHDRPEHHAGRGLAYELTVELVRLLKEAGYTFVPLDGLPQAAVSQPFAAASLRTYEFGDPLGWSAEVSHYGSIRLGDVDGDGRADVCGRGTRGVICATSNGEDLGRFGVFWTREFRDPAWRPSRHGSTLQLGDVNGDGRADVCGRAADGVYCATSDGGRFVSYRRWTDAFSDAEGWGALQSYYGSIRLGDVNGDGRADCCGRRDSGVWCALSRGRAFARPRPWIESEYRDDQGWQPPEYGATLQLGDVDGDGRADVCGRSLTGMRCARSDGARFVDAAPWTAFDFGDAAGWAESPSRYLSVALVDVDGDGRADACGRIATGVVCAASSGSSFWRYRHVKSDGFSDRTGWAPVEHGSTVRFGDVSGDGRPDLCGRAPLGIVCSTAVR